MILCSLLALASAMILGVNPMASIEGQVSAVVFLVSAAAFLLVHGKRANLALLIFILLQYPVGAAIKMID